MSLFWSILSIVDCIMFFIVMYSHYRRGKRIEQLQARVEEQEKQLKVNKAVRENHGAAIDSLNRKVSDIKQPECCKPKKAKKGE